MKQRKQSKIIAILALCVSVLGLTLGFAAFSNTLTISSSAVVSPNASDFKIAVYGIPSIGEYDQAAADNYVYRDNIAAPISKYTSTTTSMPILSYGASSKSIDSTTAKNAIISNNGNGTISISDLSVTFAEPDQHIEYYFVLKNEGEYDAYLNIYSQQLPTHTCTPGVGTTASYVEQACNDMAIQTMIGIPNDDGTYKRVAGDILDYVDEKGNLKIEKGGYIYFIVHLAYTDRYNQARADGLFSVNWKDMNITFTSTAQ